MTLKPCPTPWCTQSEPYIFHRAGDIYGVACKNCGVMTDYQHGQEPAVAQWNTRALPLDGDVVERLKEWALDKSSTHHRLAHENPNLRTEHIASSTAYRNLAEEVEGITATRSGDGL